MNTLSAEFYWVAVVAVSVISVARLTRLLVADKFPPSQWLRHRYEDLTDGSDWQWLMFCGYCMSFWMALLVVGSGYFVGVYSLAGGDLGIDGLLWWLFNGVLAVAYLAAVFMANDGDDS